MGHRIENCISPEKSVHENYDASSDSDESRNDNRNDNRNDFDDNLKTWTRTFKELRNSDPQPSPLLLLQMHKSQK